MGAEKQKIADDAFSSANECVKQMLNNWSLCVIKHVIL
jgi:hypothetical protein